MKVEWLYEAQIEFQDILSWYLVNVGRDAAARFSDKILSAVEKMEQLPEMGVLREDLLIGKYGFRALFVDKYVCIYRIDRDHVFLYHFADARTNYIYNIFGIDPYAD